MIDFHSHILPDVDDGSSSYEMSSNMLNTAFEDGTRSICATPHFIPGEYEVEREKYEKKLYELKNGSGKKELNILSGLEIYIHPDIPYLYKSNKIWGINDKRYLLIELPMREFPLYTERILYQLRLQGAIPLIAHPERNLSIMKNPDLLVNLVEQGNFTQVNAGSLTGLYGGEIKRIAEKLIQMNLIHVIGSDGHNDTKRTTQIKKAFDRIKSINIELGNWIEENEADIVNGNEVETLEIRSSKRKKNTIFSFLKR